MSLDIVNGYLCLNCTDVALAKKGINPAKPQDNPQSPDYNPAQAKADRGPAFQLSGALASSGASGSSGDGLPPVNGAGGSSPASTTPLSSTAPSSSGSSSANQALDILA